MFDISSVNKRYFEIKLSNIFDEEGKEYKVDLEVEPPKLKAIKKLTSISKAASKDISKESEDDAVEDLQDAMRIILNKNKARYKVPQELIENLDIDQMKGILTSFFGWLNDKKRDPN